MKFGVTFYPDQHPKEIWEKAFKQIKDTGFEIVRFNEMSWDQIEPKEGKWSFKDLDEAMDLCTKYELKVLLGIPTSQAPQWLIKKYPELLNVAHDGTIHPEYGPRPNACRDNPILKKYAEKLTNAIAKRYAKHPALYMWQLDNEPNYPPLDITHNKDYCHCSATKIAFVKWAKNKYKTIENLNANWGTRFWTGSFSSFEEITTPKCGMWDAGNPHIFLDWYRFKSESLSAWLLNLKKIVRKFDTEHKIGTNSFTSLPNRIGDHLKLAEGMEWFGWDIYPKGTENPLESLSQIADYWRSVCEATGSEFIVSELQGGPNVRWGHPGNVTGDEIKEWVRLLKAHGATTILFHNFMPPLFGSETSGFGLTKPNGDPTERLTAVKEIIEELKGTVDGFDESFESNHPKTLGTLIYYSKDSEIQTYQEEGPSRPCPPTWFSGRGDLGLFFGANSLAGAYKLSGAAEFIFDKQLEEGKINAKVLILTNPYLLSEKQLANILNFVNNGGILISESRFGLKDRKAYLYENPLVEKLLEIKYAHTEILNEPTSIEDCKGQAVGFLDSFEGYSSPCIIEKKLGPGIIYYANFSLFSSVLKWDKKTVENMKSKLMH